ncbi:MAG: bifunctional diaminohydroxyphosphoribosylaminopyrimidine deaminase/5-amino-6-(5-phosphoribosylamino)uracil reductase RibD [Bacteroidota bacterium]
MNIQHIPFIKRCFDLARLGNGHVAPNPMVGAVLVHNQRIIGEGYHKAYGKAHAEVNAVGSVKESDKHLIPDSTIYVSLEPCNFFGKTPPCTGLILKNKIPRVVISSFDNTPEVAGKAAKMLQTKGVEVITAVLQQEGDELNRIRTKIVANERPYVLLKYAQSKDGYFAPADDKQFWITNAFSKRLVHKWRSECDAIIVGTNTAAIDDPQLNNRLYFGKSPLRIVLDQSLKLRRGLHLFSDGAPTLLVTEKKLKAYPDYLEILNLPFDDQLLPNLLKELHQRKIGSLMVEGGAQLLQSFIKSDLWDEARVLTGDVYMQDGIKSPRISATPSYTRQLKQDLVEWYFN